jgi:hypothetical protein
VRSSLSVRTSRRKRRSSWITAGIAPRRPRRTFESPGEAHIEAVDEPPIDLAPEERVAWIAHDTCRQHEPVGVGAKPPRYDVLLAAKRAGTVEAIEAPALFERQLALYRASTHLAVHVQRIGEAGDV